MDSNKEYCLCLVCEKQHTCDFSLSAWAAQARMKNSVNSPAVDRPRPKLSFMTYKCDWFVRDEKLLTPAEEKAGGKQVLTLLNFKAGEVTKNGNTYTEKSIEDAFKEFNNKDTKFIVKLTQENKDKTQINLNDVVGKVERLYVQPTNGNLVIDSFVNEEIMDLIKKGEASFSTMGYANVNPDKTIDIFNITAITVSKKGEFA